MLRQLVESEGHAVIAAKEVEQLELDWHASECRVLREDGQVSTRLYMGGDVVFVLVVTQADSRINPRVIKTKMSNYAKKQPHDRGTWVKPLASAVVMLQ